MKDVTPDCFRCGNMDALCPAVLRLEHADVTPELRRAGLLPGHWAVRGTLLKVEGEEGIVLIDPRMIASAVASQDFDAVI
jgi:hypothetical protein